MSIEIKQKPRIWAVVPAAGIGSRMTADKPKQYIKVAGKTVLEHSINSLLMLDVIKGVQLCIAANDKYWQELNFEHQKLLPVVPGGEQRADTVLAGLEAISHLAKDDDWIMVHDAARPCVNQSILLKLINNVLDHPVGGLLAIPVADTIKKATSMESSTVSVESTISRDSLWLAQTPQMFKYEVLKASLINAKQQQIEITDEASAIEQAGYRPLIVSGHRSNIKLTYQEDLDWVECFLNERIT